MKDPLHFPSQTDGTRTAAGAAPAEPHNLEAERALLGAILLEPDILPHVRALLQPADFFVERHTLIFACMSAVAEHGLAMDYVTVAAELEARGRIDDIGGSSYLTSLINEAPTARGYPSYAALIHECALRRRLMHKTLQIAYIAMHEKDVDVRQLVAGLQREMEAAQPAARREAWTLCTLDADSEADKPLEFVVDALLPTQSLTMVYGAPGTLKSMLLADLAVCVAGGKPWLAPADSDWQMAEGKGRMANVKSQEADRHLPSAISHSPSAICQSPSAIRQTMPVPVLWIDLDNGKRRSLSRFRALLRGHDLPADLPFSYVSMPTPTLNASADASIDALIALARDVSVGLIVIDNLRLISGAVDENTAAMSGVLANLKRVAEATSAAVVVVHHARKSNGLGGSALDSIRGHSSIPAALDLGLRVEREEGADIVRVSGGKIRDFPVEEFAARWTYTLRADSPELETARFYAVALAEAGGRGKGSGDAAVEEAILDLLADGPLNKAHLEAKVRAALPDARQKHIRRIADEMIGVTLKISAGERHTKLLELV